MKDKVVYEVLRVIDGKPLFLEDHLERMKNSFDLINEEFLLKNDEIKEKIKNLINKENKLCGNIKITYSITEKKLDIFFIKHSYPTDEMYDNGVKVILYFGERENPNAKIVNDNFRSGVNKEIENNNAYEAILIDRNGFITEGSRSNIFMIKNNVILTSPTKAVLPGVTRKKVLELANQLNLKVEEQEYNYKKINELDGMFISGTSPKILPIYLVNDVKLDEKNSIILKLMKAYDDSINKYLND
ncbi:aminotransferase class IV [Clostridium neonatale]|uniref:Aminotransferase class IV n=1 Tax=Clostridium neonatale TaxID=137838 RepID=A0A2A7MLZ9_9CLOT|nr:MULTISPECIES: aminotransferase class IV [Clostridium]MDU4478363.1 aminotransferase class IV [Clostridium sp.]MDU4846960.1 aminotransferase class IV [Clostridium sp.]PEG26866.1 aminotransferase class IV [Clostridium neonatale]PEG32822.1 aminotransferase class IV [Clostridium neonatale]CAG9702452.1 Putative aminotransferase class IV [Clostridium neonatale]